MQLAEYGIRTEIKALGNVIDYLLAFRGKLLH